MLNIKDQSYLGNGLFDNSNVGICNTIHGIKIQQNLLKISKGLYFQAILLIAI